MSFANEVTPLARNPFFLKGWMFGIFDQSTGEPSTSFDSVVNYVELMFGLYGLGGYKGKRQTARKCFALNVSARCIVSAYVCALQ